MPLYDYACNKGHIREVWESMAEHGASIVVCNQCRQTMTTVVGSRINAYFEEGRGRWIYNLGDQPVFVTSHKQHKDLMKKAGVVEAGATLPSPKYRNPKHAQSRTISERGRWF